jgi:hypothetical protein
MHIQHEMDALDKALCKSDGSGDESESQAAAVLNQCYCSLQCLLLTLNCQQLRSVLAADAGGSGGPGVAPSSAASASGMART